MESATPGVKSTDDGWLNRTLRAERAADASPFRAVALAPTLPRSLQGSAPALAIGQIGQFGIHDGASGGDARRVLRGAVRRRRRLGSEGRGPGSVRSREAVEAGRPHALPAGRRRELPGERVRAGAASRLRSSPSRMSASRSRSPKPATGTITSTRAARRASSPTRLDDFGRGLAALAADLGDRMSDTVIMTMSEFGRAVSENGNRGTDHGHGNAMLVMGAGVKGGHVYGRWPGLSQDAALRWPRPGGDDRLQGCVR